jgi:tetratricopeptide (TPR) repeat protein
MYLNNLGIALQRRFEQTQSIEDIDRAVQMNKKAVASTFDNHPHYASRFNNLGAGLQSRFELTGEMEDLNQAITAKEQAVPSSPDDHPGRAMYLDNLGNLLQRRFERTRSIDDLNRAIRMKEQAVTSRMAPPSIRIQAADSVSKLLIDRDWDRAKKVLQIAVGLLPSTSPRNLKHLDRQYNISKFAGLTSRAASVSLQCGEKPYIALQLLELGNGVLASLQLQVRSDILDLRESYPDLAQQFYVCGSGSIVYQAMSRSLPNSILTLRLRIVVFYRMHSTDFWPQFEGWTGLSNFSLPRQSLS